MRLVPILLVTILVSFTIGLVVGGIVTRKEYISSERIKNYARELYRTERASSIDEALSMSEKFYKYKVREN